MYLRIKEYDKNDILNCFVLGCVLFFSAGFYEYSVMLFGVLTVMLLAFRYCSGRSFYIIRTKRLYSGLNIPFAVFAFSIIAVLWALDKVMAAVGVARSLPLLVFMYYCFQIEDDEKDRMLRMLPVFGLFMVTIGLISLFSVTFKDRFWQADRFGGFFQYSNSCALFLLICIVVHVRHILVFPKIEDKRKFFIWCFELMLLIIGFLLTGSRSVFILGIIYGIFSSVKNIRIRRVFLPILIFGLACLGVISFITGNTQNVGRIFTVLRYSSTFWGRILYYKDGFKILFKYPFGLGYMGYYYVEPVYQNGMYTTRFIHNELLQAALDLSVISAILILVYIVFQFLKGRQTEEKKEILALILLASLFDFHLQFYFIMIIAVLCLDLGRGEDAKRMNSKTIKENIVLFSVVAVGFVYLLIPFIAIRVADYKTSLSFLPHYTPAEEEVLKNAEDVESAERIAKELISHNKYAFDAYRYLAYAEVMNGKYDSAVAYLDKFIAIKRYDKESYLEYDGLLDDMLSDPQNPPETIQMLNSKKDSLPLVLKKLQSTTDPLSYRLKDSMDFSWE